MGIYVDKEMPKGCGSCPFVTGFWVEKEGEFVKSNAYCRLNKMFVDSPSSRPSHCELMEINLVWGKYEKEIKP